MPSKRHWKQCFNDVSDFNSQIAEDYAALEAALDQAIAERDRARETAAALEGETARIRAAVEAVAAMSVTPIAAYRDEVLACFDAVEAE